MILIIGIIIVNSIAIIVLFRNLAGARKDIDRLNSPGAPFAQDEPYVPILHDRTESPEPESVPSQKTYGSSPPPSIVDIVRAEFKEHRDPSFDDVIESFEDRPSR